MTLSDLLKQEPRPKIVKRATFTCWRVVVTNDSPQWQMRSGSGEEWRDSSASFGVNDLIADDWEEVKGDN